MYRYLYMDFNPLGRFITASAGSIYANHDLAYIELYRRVMELINFGWCFSGDFLIINPTNSTLSGRIYVETVCRTEDCREVVETGDVTLNGDIIARAELAVANVL